MRHQADEDQQTSVIERNLAQSGPRLEEASAARQQLHSAERDLQTSLDQMSATLRDRPAPNSVLAQVDRVAAQAAVSDTQQLLRGAETAFRQSEIAAVSARNQMEAGVSDSTRAQAESLRREQAAAFQQYANALEATARLNTIQLQTAIYTRAGDLNQVVRGTQNAVIAVEQKYSAALRQIDDRMRALVDAPKIDSTRNNVSVDGAGTIVVRAEHGEAGTVNARWKSGVAISADYSVRANGTVTWQASASGPNQPADANKIVEHTGDQLKLLVQEAGSARQSTRQTESKSSKENGGINLQEVGAQVASGASVKDLAEAHEEAGGHVKGQLTVVPGTSQAETAKQLQTMTEEAGRNTRLVSFRIETQNNGTPLHIEQPERKRRY